MNIQALIEDYRMFRSHQALSRADRFASFRYIFGDSPEDDSRREAVEPADRYQVDEREAIKE